MNVMKNRENETNYTTIIAMKLLAMSIPGVPSGAIMNNSKKKLNLCVGYYNKSLVHRI